MNCLSSLVIVNSVVVCLRVDYEKWRTNYCEFPANDTEIYIGHMSPVLNLKIICERLICLQRRKLTCAHKSSKKCWRFINTLISIHPNQLTFVSPRIIFLVRHQNRRHSTSSFSRGWASVFDFDPALYQR